VGGPGEGCRSSGTDCVICVIHVWLQREWESARGWSNAWERVRLA